MADNNDNGGAAAAEMAVDVDVNVNVPPPVRRPAALPARVLLAAAEAAAGKEPAPFIYINRTPNHPFLETDDLVDEDLFQCKIQIRLILDDIIPVLKGFENQLKALEEKYAKIPRLNLDRFQESKRNERVESIEQLTKHTQTIRDRKEFIESTLNDTKVLNDLRRREWNRIIQIQAAFQNDHIRKLWASKSNLYYDSRKLWISQRVNEGPPHRKDYVGDDVNEKIRFNQEKERLYQLAVDRHRAKVDQATKYVDRVLSRVFAPMPDLKRNCHVIVSQEDRKVVEDALDDINGWVDHLFYARRTSTLPSEVYDRLLYWKQIVLELSQEVQEKIQTTLSASGLAESNINLVLEPLVTLTTQLKEVTDEDEKLSILYFGAVHSAEDRIYDVQRLYLIRQTILKIIKLKVDKGYGKKYLDATTTMFSKDENKLSIDELLHRLQDAIRTSKSIPTYNPLLAKMNGGGDGEAGMKSFTNFQGFLLQVLINKNISGLQIGQREQVTGNVRQPWEKKTTTFKMPELEDIIKEKLRARYPSITQKQIKKTINDLVRRHIPTNPMTTVVKAPYLASELSQLVYWAASENHVDVLKELYYVHNHKTLTLYTDYTNHELLRFACWNGSLPLLNFLHDDLKVPDHYWEIEYTDKTYWRVNLAILFAISKGHVHVLQFLHEKCNLRAAVFQAHCPYIISCATSRGFTHVLQYLLDAHLLDPPPPLPAINNDDDNNNIPPAALALDEGGNPPPHHPLPPRRPQPPPEPPHANLFHGDTRQADGTIALSDSIVKAAINGHISVLEWYRTKLHCPKEHFFPDNKYAVLVNAVNSNQIAIVHYLVKVLGLTEEGVLADDQAAIYYACQQGSVDILDFFYHQLKMDKRHFIRTQRSLQDFVIVAAIHNKVNVMRWLLKTIQLPPDAFRVQNNMLLSMAVEKSSDEMLIFLSREVGLTKADILADNAKALNVAVSRQNTTMFKLCHELFGLTRADYFDRDPESTLNACMYADDITMFHYIVTELGIPMEFFQERALHIVQYCALNNAVTILRDLFQVYGFTQLQMLAQECIALRYAARKGHDAILKLYHQTLNLVTSEFLKFDNYCLVADAVHHGKDSILHYLKDNASFTKQELVGGSDYQYVIHAAGRGHTNLLKFYHESVGVTIQEFKSIRDPLLPVVVQNRRYAMIKYLHRELSFDAEDFAFNSGQLIKQAVNERQPAMLWFLYMNVGINIDVFKCDNNAPLRTALTLKDTLNVHYLLTEIKITLTDEEAIQAEILKKAIDTYDTRTVISVCNAGVNGSLGLQVFNEANALIYAQLHRAPEPMINFLRNRIQALENGANLRDPNGMSGPIVEEWVGVQLGVEMDDGDEDNEEEDEDADMDAAEEVPEPMDDDDEEEGG